MNWLGDYLGYLAGALLATVPIVNPFGAVPIVMSASAHLPEAERQRQIRRACVYAFALMAGVLIAGGLTYGEKEDGVDSLCSRAGWREARGDRRECWSQGPYGGDRGGASLRRLEDFACWRVERRVPQVPRAGSPP